MMKHPNAQPPLQVFLFMLLPFVLLVLALLLAVKLMLLHIGGWGWILFVGVLPALGGFGVKWDFGSDKKDKAPQQDRPHEGWRLLWTSNGGVIEKDKPVTVHAAHYTGGHDQYGPTPDQIAEAELTEEELLAALFPLLKVRKWRPSDD